MIELAAVFAANFLFIFLKAFQQRNVMGLHYAWVVPTSFAMAVAEVGVIGIVAVKATQAEHFLDMWPMIVSIALGGGIGCVASMWVHYKIVRAKP